jgi:Holliday junction DNA helicase RuvA
MYYYLNGTLTVLEPDFVVIDCGGVGYKCSVTASAYRKLPKIGEQVKLFTYFHIREDIMDLYGFIDSDEHNCFKMLLGVSGVGPKVALSILSEMTPEQFSLGVATADAKILTRAPGVGPKLAQRIILELKDKIKSEQLVPAAVDLSGNGFSLRGTAGEVISALTALGYSRSEAAAALSGVDLPEMTVEEAVKAALKRLMKG